MKNLNRNLKNLLSLFSVEFITRFVAFLSVTYLARILGTSGFGLLNIALAVLSYAMIVSNGGLTLLGTKKIAGAENNLPSLAGNIFLTRLFFSGVIFIIASVVVYFFVSAEESVNIILVYLFFLFPSAVLLEWFYHGIQSMEVIAYGRAVGMISYLIFLLVFVASPGDILLTGVGWTVGGIINSAFLIYIFKKRNFSLKFNIKNLELLSLLKESFPLGAAQIIGQFVIMFPVIYIGVIAGNSEAGIFSAAYKLIVLLLILDRVFYSLFFPKIVKLYQLNKSTADIEIVFNKTLKIISYSGFVSLLAAVAVSDYLIVIIFGTSFSGSVLVFQVLLGSFYLTLINSVFTYSLIAINKEKAYILALISGMLLFLPVIIILTGKFAVEGAAAALVAFDLICLVVMYLNIKEKIKIEMRVNILFPAGVVILALLFVLNPFVLWVKIFIAAVTIIIISLIMKIKDEIPFVKNIFYS